MKTHDKVKVTSTSKKRYRLLGVVGMCGEIKNVFSKPYHDSCPYHDTYIGVKIDNLRNDASDSGLFWFEKNELELIKEFNEEEKNKMLKFNYVAIVNLLEDYSPKDYDFALYDEDYREDMEDLLVVVNARGKNKRVLGRIKKIIPAVESNQSITAQVVAVIDETAYKARLEKEERLAIIAKKKEAIERELAEEISKKKTIEFYKKAAEEYSDNPKLAELVNELEALETL